jgi:transposase
MATEQTAVAVEPLKVTSHGHRFFGEEYKRAVVEKCLAPGASLSAVALAHGFNANLVRKWVDQHRRRVAARKGAKLLAVTVKGKMVRKRQAYRRRSTVVRTVSAMVPSVIELEVGSTKLTLRGDVDRAQLRAVLETLAQMQ